MRYFYCRKLDTIILTDADSILQTRKYYQLSDRVGVPGVPDPPEAALLSRCKSILASQLDSQNWMQFYTLALSHNDQDLKRKAKEKATVAAPDLVVQILESHDQEIKKLTTETEKSTFQIKELTAENKKLTIENEELSAQIQVLKKKVPTDPDLHVL